MTWVYLVLAVWAALCLTAAVASLGDLVTTMKRVAAAVEAQNGHYGISPLAATVAEVEARTETS